MLRFQLRTASSLRSRARFSGFCGLKPSEPRMRQICVWPKRTPCKRSMTAPTRLSVHSSVANPCSIGLRRSVARTAANCCSSSWAGRPRSGTARNASIPPSSSSPFHVYTVCRATPTALATSAQPLPASSSRPAFNRFFVASLNRFCTMATFSNITLGDTTSQTINGCQDLRKCQ